MENKQYLNEVKQLQKLAGILKEMQWTSTNTTQPLKQSQVSGDKKAQDQLDPKASSNKPPVADLPSLDKPTKQKEKEYQGRRLYTDPVDKRDLNTRVATAKKMRQELNNYLISKGYTEIDEEPKRMKIGGFSATSKPKTFMSNVSISPSHIGLRQNGHVDNYNFRTDELSNVAVNFKIFKPDLDINLGDLRNIARANGKEKVKLLINKSGSDILGYIEIMDKDRTDLRTKDPNLS